jgi:UDP-N-acetylglucosamine transferase subunit ALG13
MILILTGTHYLPFDRLLKYGKKLRTELKLKQKIVVQAGTSKVTFSGKNVVRKKFFTFTELTQLMKKAQVIITHAGPATLFQAATTKARIIVVPRHQQYGEHVSDHQYYFTQALGKKKYLTANSYEEFKTQFRAKDMREKQRTSTSKLAQKLTSYLQTVPFS